MIDSDSKITLFKAAGLIGVFTLLSRIIGLVRDRLFASTFGAGDFLDSYYAAFRIPDLVFNLLVLGTMSAAFIPVFTQYRVKDPKEAQKFANSILTISFLGMALLCIVLFIFVPELTKLVAPGFEGEKYENTVKMTRIFLLSPIIFTVSSVFSSILNAMKRFFLVSLAPIIYNFGIIIGIVVLYPRFGASGLAWGVIIGALGHLAAQGPGTLSTGFKIRISFDWSHSGVQDFFRLFLPRILGVDSAQVSLLIASIIGSTLISGSISVFNLANNLQAVAIGMFGISFAIAAFPTLSENYAKRNEEHFNSIFARTLVHILYFVVPISIIIIVLRAEIVDVILRAGNFDAGAASVTAGTLGIFAISIFAQSLSPLFSRTFYSRHNTVIPVAVGLISLLISAGSSYALGKTYGVFGLAWGFTFANIFNAAALFTILRFKLNPDLAYVRSSAVKICFSAAVCGISVLVLRELTESIFSGSAFIPALLRLILAGSVGTVFYFVNSLYFGMTESKSAWEFVKARIIR